MFPGTVILTLCCLGLSSLLSWGVGGGWRPLWCPAFARLGGGGGGGGGDKAGEKRRVHREIM